MARRLLTFLSALSMVLSLTLLLAMAALWIRSRWAADAWGHVTFVKGQDWVRSRSWNFVSSTEGVGFTYRGSNMVVANPNELQAVRLIGAQPGWSHDHEPPNLAMWGIIGREEPYRMDWRWAGRQRLLFSRTDRAGDSLVQFGVVLPFWLPLIVTAALPSWFAVKRVRRLRRLPGLCRTCGYDLRATPDKCPECGTVPAANNVP